jgi:hypothetical protein
MKIVKHTWTQSLRQGGKKLEKKNYSSKIMRNQPLSNSVTVGDDVTKGDEVVTRDNVSQWWRQSVMTSVNDDVSQWWR